MTIKLYKHERNPDHVTDVRLSLCLCFCCLVLPVKEFGGFVLNLKYFSAAIALVADWQIILQSWNVPLPGWFHQGSPRLLTSFSVALMRTSLRYLNDETD